MFITMLFTIVKKKNEQPSAHSLTNEPLECGMYTQILSSLTEKKILSLATLQMNLKDTI